MKSGRGKKALCVVAGVVVGVVVSGAIQMISILQNPMPEGVQISDTEAMKAYINGLPTSAFILVLISHASAALAGSLTCASIIREKWIVGTVIIGCVFLLSGILNLVSIPHPDWFKVADLILYLPAAFLGAWIAGLLFRSTESIETPR